jgi:hypothetical protein
MEIKKLRKLLYKIFIIYKFGININYCANVNIYYIGFYKSDYTDKSKL